MRTSNLHFASHASVLRHMFIIALSALVLTACSDDPKESTIDPKPWEHDGDIDNSVLPGNDFYQYAVGGWLKTATFPVGKEIYGIFLNSPEIQAQKLTNLINTTKDPIVNRLFQESVNETLTEQNSMNALNKHLQLVQSIDSKQELLKQIGTLVQLGYKPFFSVGIFPLNTFFKAYLNSGYTDFSFTSLNDYQSWVSYCFQKLGYSSEKADLKAENTIRIEKFIKSVTNPNSFSLKYWEKPDNYKHLKSSFQSTRSSNDDDDILLSSFGFDPSLWEEILSPARFVFQYIEESEDIEPLKDYMENCIIQANSNFLPNEILQKKFEFMQNPTPPSRNELTNEFLQTEMVYHLSRLFVEKYTDPSYKEAISEMTKKLKETFQKRIKNLSWMGETTKSRAIAKLDAMTFNIGYPDTWNELGSPRLNGNCLCADIISCREQNYRLQTCNLGKSIQTSIWEYVILGNSEDERTPLYIVNAFYMPNFNSFIIPVGIMSPPFYDLSKSEACAYGMLGTVIGHEMTHGFDNKGSMFNQDGEIEDWWTLVDKMKFKEKQDLLVKYFNSMFVIPGTHANGEKTLGENIADLGGVEISHQAFMEKKEAEGFNGTELEEQEKKFYLAYAEAWRCIYSDNYVLNKLNDDVHSIPKLRINGIVIHTDAWYKAFDVQDGENLYLPEDQRVHIW